MATHSKPSAAYLAALDTANAAARVFRAAQEDYRARRTGDAEFLKAREVYTASEREFDAAFATEERSARPAPFCRPLLCFTERQACAVAAALVQARIPYAFAGAGETTGTIDFLFRGEDYARACELAQLAAKL